jgi:hypothetical protein
MTAKQAARPKLGAGVVVLLVIISVANVFALVLTVEAWQDEASHGGDLQGMAAFSALLTVIALVGVAGAWLRRTWGPGLYFGAQATGFVFLLIAAPSAISLLSFVPLLLAGLLWLLTSG